MRRFLHATTTRNCLSYIKIPLGRLTTNKSYPNSVLWSSSYEKAISREEKHWNWQFEWNTEEISRSEDFQKCKIFFFSLSCYLPLAWNKIIDYRDSLFLYSIVVKSAKDPLYGSSSHVYPSIKSTCDTFTWSCLPSLLSIFSSFVLTEMIKSRSIKYHFNRY